MSAAWTFVAEPDTDGGPCDDDCPHAECGELRAAAEADCRYCGSRIGYGQPYRIARSGQPYHVDCHEERSSRPRGGGALR